MSSLSDNILTILNSVEPLFGRKALQKKIYFAQVLGIDLGYDFKWYKYGPYSFDLADEIDFLMSFGEVEINNQDYSRIIVNTEDIVELDELEKEKITKLNTLTHNLTPNELELMASIYFLVHEAGVGKNKSEVFDKLEDEKPDKFSYSEKETFWNKLEEFKLI